MTPNINNLVNFIKSNLCRPQYIFLKPFNKQNITVSEIGADRFYTTMCVNSMQIKDAPQLIKSFHSFGATNVVVRYELNDSEIYSYGTMTLFGEGQWAVEFTLIDFPDWYGDYQPPAFLFKKTQT